MVGSLVVTGLGFCCGLVTRLCLTINSVVVTFVLPVGFDI